MSSVALLCALRIRRVSDVRTASTPGRRGLFILANLAWLAFAPAQWLWLYYTYKRGDYPWWGDIILIPAASYLLVFSVALPVVNLGTFLCTRGRHLPCRIAQRFDSGRAITAALLLLVPAGFISMLAWAALEVRDPFTAAVVPPALYAVLSHWSAVASSGAALRRCSCALFVRDGKFLLGRRSQAKRLYPDIWDLIGGHAKPGKTPEAALLREVEEEIGSVPMEFSLLEIAPEPDPDANGPCEYHVYVVRDWTGPEPFIRNAEHVELGWFTPGEARELRLADPAYVALFERVEIAGV